MKAVFCEKLGTPDELVIREIDAPPAPGPGEVKVSIKARGLSFPDVLMVAGEYQVKPELPFIIGGESAGVVTDVGEGVDTIAVGDHLLCPGYGGCVEQMLVSAKEAILLPNQVSFDVAAAFRANYATALYGFQRARLQAGETLLIHGAGGGVGLAAIDMAKLMGARVIAAASTEEKRAAALKMGADHVIDYTQGFREQVKALTDGLGADVIYDPVGGDVFDESMRCIAPFGRILVVGFAGGRAAEAKTNHLLIKDAEVIGFTLGGLRKKAPEWYEKNSRILMGWLASGRINPYISQRLPLENTVEALNLIKNREVIGKVVLVS